MAPTGRRIGIEDVVVRTGLMLLVVVGVAAVVWQTVPVTSRLWFGAFIGALVLSWVISRKQVTNPVVLLGFAAVEGVLVGVVSKVFTQYAGGVVTQAILATLCTAAVVLALYAFRIVRVTNRMIQIVVAVTIGFVLTRLVLFLLAATGIYPGGFDFGALDLVLTLVGAGLAAVNLLLDFEFVDRAIKSGMSEKYAWTAAFGLTVTLVWLYMEFLRLFSILRN
jgi:uncharacterized YccA/Bax inhibitor family protein